MAPKYQNMWPYSEFLNQPSLFKSIETCTEYLPLILNPVYIYGIPKKECVIRNASFGCEHKMFKGLVLITLSHMPPSIGRKITLWWWWGAILGMDELV